MEEGGSMKVGSRRTILSAMGAAIVCLLAVALAGGQGAGPEQKPLMAEDAFKNVQVLKGLTVNEFMETMGFFAASLNANCTYCHVDESGGNWAKYADDNENKQTARKMVLMMNAINKTNFGGKREVTCYTCHHFANRPKITPNLAEQYGTPAQEDPDQIEQAPGAPSADQVLDKYIQAIGGAQRLATITSFVAKGTYQAYDDSEMHPAEVYAKAPGQRTTVMHTLYGDSTTTCDGRSGWLAAPTTDKPVPVVGLTGNDLDGIKVDADLSFPARIKQTLGKWVVGSPLSIEDRDVDVVQGTSAAGTRVKLYFDKQSGLLVRFVRYTELPIGFVSTQTDYSDYRDVAGIKMPFKWTTTWVDGRLIFEMNQIQTNVPIDAAKFGKPAAPALPKSGTP
jgi:hypothetical protein